MQFTTLIAALLPASALVNAAPAITKRAMGASTMVDNINAITKQSQNLQPIISQIQTGNSVIAKRQGNPFQPAIDGFQSIIQTANTDINAMSGTTPYNNADAQLVCNAFSNFVVVHQELLRIVIGKSGLLEGIFLGPVAAVLRSLESVVDTLAFGIIGAVPGCEATATEDKRKLDTTLGKAVCAYTPGGSLGVDLFC